MNEYTVSNIGELIRAIHELPQERTYWFRGHAIKELSLIPSVQRAEYAGKEQSLANDFYMKASVTLLDKPDFRSYSDWITIMRHFGLPTRLLDWSRSPLIAAYFCVSSYKETFDRDGCIWVLDPAKLNVHEGFNDYLYSIDSHTAVEMIRPAFKKEYVPEDEKVTDKILACYPIEHNLRVYVQQSAFTLHNTNRKLEDIASEDILSKFIIPGKSKKNIFRELETLGVGLSYIYPDSDHIAAELCERYKN